MNSDIISVEGRIKAYAINPITKEIISFSECKNTITTQGKARIAGLSAGINTPIRYLGVGSSSTAPNASQTALQSELSPRIRKSVSGSLDGATVTFSGTYYMDEANNGTGNNNVFAEVALFDASEGGLMFCRGLLNPIITKDQTMEIIIYYQLTFA